MSLNLSFVPPICQEPPTKRIYFLYYCANWDWFRVFFAYVLWNYIFNHPILKCASELSCVNETSIQVRKYQAKSRRSPCFTPACSAIIAHRNRIFRLYQSDISVCNRCPFISACNMFKRVFKKAMFMLADRMIQSINSNYFGSRDC